MVNRKIWFVILAVTLVFVFAVVGCKGDEVDTALNGTWVDEDGMEIKFDNGNFELKNLAKGTYTTSDKDITITVTHIHGEATGILEAKWYTKAEMRTAFTIFIAGGYITEAEVNEMLNEMFSSQTGTYSISGNKLTMTADGETSIYTKK
jgi:hypothetical protein